MTVLNKQVDGKHYTSMKLQPIQLTYLLSETPCFCKVAKYLTRLKDDKLSQIEKAEHCAQLESALYEINNLNYPQEVLDILPEGHEVTYKPHSDELAWKLIDMFTDDQDVRDVLVCFNMGEYGQASAGIKMLLDSIKGDDK